MNMVDISVFYDEAATRISGAPIDVIRQQLEGTLREFYVRSGAYIVDTPGTNIKPKRAEYDLNPQTGGEVLVVYDVRVKGVSVAFRGGDEPGQIILGITYPSEVPKGLKATVALKPFSYDLIPEATVTFDFDVILDGVTGRMFMMPDRPWSNAPQAAYYLKRFRQGQGQARVRTKARYTQAPTPWKYPAW